jgi:outer membrane protein OmpA-like peptidoglycan-associated protein
MAFDKRGFALFAAGLVLATPAFAEGVKTEAVITARTNDSLTVRTREGDLTIVLTPGTTIKEVSGRSKKTRAATTLIPGLIIKVEGDRQGQTLTAGKIEYKQRDWRAAISTKAGTQEQFTELRRAIIEGHEYVVQDEVVVYFPTNVSAVGETYKQPLRALAQKAPSFGNYRISIIGYADSRGNPEANERLSLKRAMAVSNFLRQTGAIQPGRVLSPTAMGEAAVAPGDAVPTSLDEARRVVVRVVTPKTQLTQ